MSIAYGLEGNNNICCMIPTNGGEEIYYIGEISTKYPSNQDERRLLLLKLVSANTGIHHNHLVKLAQELGNIAKRTIEKELKNLQEDDLLESEKEGEIHSNGTRTWSIKSPEFEYEKHAKQESKNIVTSLEQYVNTIEKIFEKLNDVQKDYAIANLLEITHSWQPIIEIINQDTKIKNEKKKFESLVEQAYAILQRHDKRDYIDGRPFLRRLLHLKASEPMMSMNNFLEEINSVSKET